jgi:hypothetical protein
MNPIYSVSLGGRAPLGTPRRSPTLSRGACASLRRPWVGSLMILMATSQHFVINAGHVADTEFVTPDTRCPLIPLPTA